MDHRYETVFIDADDTLLDDPRGLERPTDLGPLYEIHTLKDFRTIQ